VPELFAVLQGLQAEEGDAEDDRRCRARAVRPRRAVLAPLFGEK
jgi:hypothetical protein